MNTFILLSAVLALLTVLGHFLVGQKQFLIPMLEAHFDTIAKNVMHAVFHYVSVFLLLSAVTLLISGLGYLPTESARVLCVFIGLNYLLFAAWQIVIALKSGLNNPLMKLFQWIFFVLIACFALAGAMTL